MIRIASVTALLLISCAAFAQSQSPPPSAGESQSDVQQQGAGNQRQPDIGPPGRPLTVRIAKDEIETAQEEQDRRRESTLQGWNTAVTVAIALFTFGLVCIGIAQARIYRRQLDLMDGALTETRRSADAAMASASVAERTLRTTQRAFLGLGNWEIDGLHDGKQAARLSFVMDNQGQTLATTTLRYVRQRAAKELPPAPVYAPSAARVRVPIPPRHRTRQWVQLSPLDSDDLTAVFAGTKTLWFWGYVEYVDAFEESHRTGFCVCWDSESKSLRLAGPDGYNYAT